MATDPGAAETRAALSELTDPAGAFLIGVRHHAPSLAAAVPHLLDAAEPDVLLVELPAELQDWLPWLAHEETRAPVALAAVPGGDPRAEQDAGGPAFYPFADFSPELAALRWAAGRGVPAIAADLPLADRAHRAARRPAGQGAAGQQRAGVGDALRARLTGRPGDDLWDRLVEATAPGSPPEALRRAALLTGWALRRDAAAKDGGVDPLDLARERWMRARLTEATAGGRRAAAVVGAFHTPALTPAALRDDAGDPADVGDVGDAGDTGERPPAALADGAWTVSLIPYTYALLDERSGYPAGIRDPEWQHLVLGAAGDPAALHDALTRTAVRICAALRAQDHPSGPADSREISRLAGDLARLRGLPAPGRGELIEAVQTVLAQGEPLGRGRAVSRALEDVLVGARTGRPAPGTPRGGLGPAVEAAVADLGLPGPGDAAGRELRLDTRRSALDRRRELLLRRLTVCGVPYAEEQRVAGTGGAEALTTRWQARWTPATAAMLVAAGVRGVTPAQAAEGTLRARHRAERAAGGPTAAQVITGLDQAAACALDALTAERLAEAATLLPVGATLPELLAALTLLDRLRATGHAVDALAEALTTAAIRQVEGLTGSDELADARALVELAHRADAFGGMRLAGALGALAAEGSPMMRGAAAAVRTLLGLTTPERLGGLVASWVDAAGDPDARAALTARLGGLLTAAGPLLEASPATLGPLLDRISELPDRRFLDRLPALRGGFDTLSPAARDRLLDVVEERIGGRVAELPDTDPVTLERWTRADLAAAEALAAQGLLPPPPADGAHADRADTADRAPAPAPPAEARALGPADRWRLLLGRRADRLPRSAAPLATALDELYGRGRGEGSRGDVGRSAGGGRQAPYPGVREWSEELAVLFGPSVRQEVLAAAVAAGRHDAVLALDPDAVRPSVDLLRTVLRHAGGLPEARVARLRPLVGRLVEALTRELATRLRPALNGAAHPRPTRRPTGRLDLPRTLRANLRTARRSPEGDVVIVPERPVFRGRAARSADWRLILVTDVSGSMESSTIWSALTAAVFAGVPALSTHFLAFSTEVIDLSGHVHDPLGLLLEVSVGGGTHIAAGLRHARSLVTAPSRTLTVVISDFEEGYPLGGLLAEVRALVDSGCHVLGCASLDDAGRPRYSTAVAGQLVAAGMPVAALSPLELARWVGEKIR
ncbi:DUF5682 family protein [Streptomyces radicis]|uniref:VWA domain-containing protein n=1 Tax=Streptomyces radicis TaxID=1750517 RepID=A0A3A9WI58_9ACTN|nr:DUF5682 family protein [Streptomyces radicis]RKN12708.1 VWA domain-containing protein [Streptomyces radicis]RKN27529.1 VWA domain-containing protein [Streptomyces radicis]